MTNLLEESDAQRLAQKIIDAVSEIKISGLEGISVGASIGIYHLPNPEARDVETVFRLSDALMYLAKKAGKNRYVSSVSDIRF